MNSIVKWVVVDSSVLVSLKDIQVSEMILKMKSLVQEGIDIDCSVKINPVCDLCI